MWDLIVSYPFLVVELSSSLYFGEAWYVVLKCLVAMIIWFTTNLLFFNSTRRSHYVRRQGSGLGTLSHFLISEGTEATRRWPITASFYAAVSLATPVSLPRTRTYTMYLENRYVVPVSLNVFIVCLRADSDRRPGGRLYSARGHISLFEVLELVVDIFIHTFVTKIETMT